MVERVLRKLVSYTCISQSAGVQFEMKQLQTTNSIATPRTLSLMYLPPLRVLSINQHTLQCHKVRDLQKEEHTMFLETSPDFMAYCAAIKHFLVRQWIYQACLLFFFFFSLPQRSNSLKVLFTNLWLLFREHDESQNHSPVHKRPKCAFIQLTSVTVCVLYHLQLLGSSQFRQTTEQISQGQHKLCPRLCLSSLNSSLCWICLTVVNIACWFQLEDKHRC